MRLSTQSDYALRTLMFAATRQDALVTIAEIAERYRISKNHLMKVVHALSRLGLLTTVRGHNGGMKLARPAADIRVGAVVRALEDDTLMVECFRRDGGRCLIAPACRLKGALGTALEAFYATLDEHSIADLVDGNDALGRLLRQEAA